MALYRKSEMFPRQAVGEAVNIEVNTVEIFSRCYVRDFIVDLHGNYFKIYF